MGITGRQRGRHVFPEGVSGASRTYAVDGPIQQLGGTHVLTKPGVGAFTLTAPASDSLRLVLINRTAFAHVLTATGLLDDGTGVSKSTATFAASPGATLTLEAAGGKWNVVGQSGMTGVGAEGGSGGGGSFDQSLNTTDSPSFANLTLTDEGLMSAPETALVIATPEGAYVDTLYVSGGRGVDGGDGGSVFVEGGPSVDGEGGSITLNGGAGGADRGGNISLLAGASQTDDAGVISIAGGNSAEGYGGSVTVSSGDGGSSPGDVSLYSFGKLKLVAPSLNLISSVDGPNQTHPPVTGQTGQAASLWVELTALGKQRLMVQFKSGAPVQIAIEP